MDLHHQSNPVKTKQLHSFQVSPPAGSLDPSAASLPITFFDVMWLNSRPMRRLFFYDFPYPTLHFTQSTLPLLRRSLSLALHRFFPLAGSLVVPPPPQLPFLCFSPASDSVPLTIAEAESDVDYEPLIGNQPRDVREFHPLVPEMNPVKVRSEDGARLSPLLAVQVTVFPNRGLCIGVQFHHVAADGMAFHCFMKLWAALLRSGATGGDVGTCDQLTLPADHLQHRELIREKYGDLESALLQQWFDWLSTWNYNAGAAPRQLNLSNKVRSTMVITKPNLDKLKARVRSANPEQAHVSTFVVTCALIWVTLIKSEGVGDSSDDPDRVYHLGFSADCRRRLGIELPESFLGNCLGPTFVGEKRGDLAAGGGGFFRAAEAIGRRVREGEWVGAAERWMPTWREVAEGGRVVVIAGSPKLKAYETDFGWGRPRKSAVVQLDSSRSVALCESGDGSGGVEVGLALEENRMEVFAKLFEEFVGQV